MAFFICPIPIKAQLDNNQPELSTPQPPELLKIPDSRVLAVSSFLDQYRCGSKIDDFNTANTFVTLADKYNIDWRYEGIFYLKESSCSQHMPGYLTANKIWITSNNPFGFMKSGGEKAGVIYFNSLDEAFEAEAKYLSTPLYAGKTIYQITHIYCPPRSGEVYTYYSDFLAHYDWITNWQIMYDKLSTGAFSK